MGGKGKIHKKTLHDLETKTNEPEENNEEREGKALDTETDRERYGKR